MKKNYLLEKIIEIFSKEQKGRLLDLGCGDGDYSKSLNDLGFEVCAVDLDEGRFNYKNDIEFKKCDITARLPFPDNFFDYVLLLEAIEHLTNPYSVIKEVNRILKLEGVLILSTPNILNLKSRMRFLFEGTFEFFREPPLEQVANPKEKKYNIHIFAYRINELEYLLHFNGFMIENILTSVYENRWLSFLFPLIKLQLFLKKRRSLIRNGIDFSRINKILLSKELMYGRHLIVKAKKHRLP